MFLEGIGRDQVHEMGLQNQFLTNHFKDVILKDSHTN